MLSLILGGMEAVKTCNIQHTSRKQACLDVD